MKKFLKSNKSDLKKSLFFFLSFEFLNFASIVLANKFIPFLGFFPYREVLLSYKLPFFFTNLGNFDGIHYINIAKQGYQTFEQAFFPVYPLAIKILSPLFLNNGLIAGIIISNISFLFSLFLVIKILKNLKFGEDKINWFLSFLILFPTSFYFQAVYTESIFLLFISIFLLSGLTNNYVLLILSGFISGGTRLIASSIFLPFILNFKQYRAKIILFFSPILGFLTYMFYLKQTVSDPLFFLNSQPAFGAHRSSHIVILPQVLYRYLKIFFTANHNFQYFVSILEFSFFLFVFLILLYHLYSLIRSKNKNLFLIGLCLFSFANLILPTLTGTLSSVPRYSLLSISVFIFLSQIKSDKIKYILLGVFVLLHMLLLGLFSQGYFIS